MVQDGNNQGKHVAKLNQIIALEKGIKSQAHSTLSELHKLTQKHELFAGLVKTYHRRDEDSEELPPESKKIQHTVATVLSEARLALADLGSITARKEWSNCHASAPILLDGVVLADKVPVTYLLFLEKQLTDLRTFVDKLPILDSNEDWHNDPTTGLYRTEVTQTHRTKKVQKPLVLYPATPEHPAQTQLVTEDVLAGYWRTVKHSGAIPAPQKQVLADRTEKLLRAVKEAREAANAMEEIQASDIAALILDYVFDRT